MVKFHDIPKVLVEAVTSIEDKRFFQHSGFDPIRIMKAVYVDVKEGRKDQGASTLSMQTARMFFLTQDKNWKRKAAEFIITLQLEQKLSKEEIFEYYANQVDLGLRGTFHIVGLGQASEAYLGKELNSITLPEAAEIAGMIQRPGYFDPFRHPDRLRDRRNIVLLLMRQNNVISDRDYALAIEAPLTVTKAGSTSVEAPYFVDMVNDKLQNMFQDADFQSNAFRIYTTIDMRLQRAAVEAVRLGMASVDEQIKKQRRFKGQTPPTPQVAMVAIDPHTGEVKALVGGRNYGLSQLNHSLAKRQPGSIFKPFVYATALDTAVSGGSHVLTASSTVVDEPTTFYFDNQVYEPSNFEKKFYGTVTLRDALAHSLNVATVKVGQMVGFDAVVDMANRAGMNYKIQPTPAVALGAYEITPVEAAGAYTIFANNGDYLKPSFLSMVRAQDGKVVYKNKVEEKQVLDPRVAYLTTSLLEEVLRSGTAAGVRARYNLTIPMAGKTGTSHDGWFAGYTSELLCVVWVGFDDNRELNLEGAHSAAPIWAEFMKRALEFREYRDVQTVPRTGRHRQHLHRPRIGYAGHAELSQDTRRSLYRRYRACGAVPAARRTRRRHHGCRLGHRRRPPPRRRPRHARSDGYGLAGRRTGFDRPCGAPRRAAGVRPGGQFRLPSHALPRRSPRRRRRRGFSSACGVCLNSSKGATWLTDHGPSFWRRVSAPHFGFAQTGSVTQNILDSTRAAPGGSAEAGPLG